MTPLLWNTVGSTTPLERSTAVPAKQASGLAAVPAAEPPGTPTAFRRSHQAGALDPAEAVA